MVVLLLCLNGLYLIVEVGFFNFGVEVCEICPGRHLCRDFVRVLGLLTNSERLFTEGVLVVIVNTGVSVENQWVGVVMLIREFFG